MKLDALVAPLRADVVSGAAVVGRTAADVVIRFAGEADRGEEEGFRERLGRLTVRILEAQPAMAPLVTLATRILTAADEASVPGEARGAVVEAAQRFKEALATGGEEVAERAREILPTTGRVVTLSHSSTVRAALSCLGADGPEVVCLESRPLSEGRTLARQLAREGIRVLFAVDAAARALIGSADAVVSGADSIGDRGAVNKIGTRSAAEAGRNAGVPVWVLADRTKLLPPGFPQRTVDDRPEKEVWRSPPGVRVWNRYFEAVPLDLLEGVVTEDAIHRPRDLDDSRREIRVPDELRRWARSRAEGEEDDGPRNAPASGEEEPGSPFRV